MYPLHVSRTCTAWERQLRPFYCSGSGIDLVEFPVDAGNVTLVGKTEVAIVPDDKVLVHCDIRHAAGEDQSSRDGNVVRRWLRVARGVVVGKDQSRCLLLQSRRDGSSGRSG